MLIWRCDCCHKEGDWIKKSWVSYRISDSDSVEILDMCDNCGRKFEDFIEELKKENQRWK